MSRLCKVLVAGISADCVRIYSENSGISVHIPRLVVREQRPLNAVLPLSSDTVTALSCPQGGT